MKDRNSEKRYRKHPFVMDEDKRKKINSSSKNVSQDNLYLHTTGKIADCFSNHKRHELTCCDAKKKVIEEREMFKRFKPQNGPGNVFFDPGCKEDYDS